jgi:hypothetical protein
MEETGTEDMATQMTRGNRRKIDDPGLRELSEVALGALERLAGAHELQAPRAWGDLPAADGLINVDVGRPARATVFAHQKISVAFRGRLLKRAAQIAGPRLGVVGATGAQPLPVQFVEAVEFLAHAAIFDHWFTGLFQHSG